MQDKYVWKVLTMISDDNCWNETKWRNKIKTNYNLLLKLEILPGTCGRNGIVPY